MDIEYRTRYNLEFDAVASPVTASLLRYIDGHDFLWRYGNFGTGYIHNTFCIEDMFPFSVSINHEISYINISKYGAFNIMYKESPNNKDRFNNCHSGRYQGVSNLIEQLFEKGVFV